MNIPNPNPLGPPRAAKSAACCACKHQRRRCAPDCLLAPYFPPENARDFENVHKLFGVGNVVKLITKTQPDMRDDTVKSLIYEANSRAKFPVDGCCAVILELQRQLNFYTDELDAVRKRLAMFHDQPPIYQDRDMDWDSVILENSNPGINDGINDLLSNFNYANDVDDAPRLND